MHIFRDHLEKVCEDKLGRGLEGLDKGEEPLDQNVLDMRAFTDGFNVPGVGLDRKVKHQSYTDIPGVFKHHCLSAEEIQQTRAREV